MTELPVIFIFVHMGIQRKSVSMLTDAQCVSGEDGSSLLSYMNIFNLPA